MEIDMGGFENEEIKVHFGGKTYKIMADPPVEAYRMFVKIQSLKLDKEKNWDKVKNFVATIISISNNIDKDKFKKSLTKFAVGRFLEGYTKVISGVGSKNLKSLPKKATRAKARSKRKRKK